MNKENAMDENYGFDRFLLEKWGSANAGEDQKARRTACRKFQKALKDNDVAAAGTIRAWFYRVITKNVKSGITAYRQAHLPYNP